MRYAFDALRRRLGRTILTALGIGLAIGLVLMLLAISAGIQTSSARLAASSGVDLLATSRNTSLGSGTFPPISGSHALAREMPAADSNVATASPWLLGDLVFGNSSLYAATNRSANGSAVPPSWAPTGAASVGWIPGANTGLNAPLIYSGAGFSNPGDPHYANGTYSGPFTHEIVLDEGLAATLGVSPGNLVWVSLRSVSGPSQLLSWFHNATVFKVVGISGPFFLLPSELLGFFYLSELQEVLGGFNVPSDASSLVLVHLVDPTTASTDQQRLEGAFPQLTVFTLSEILGALENVVDLYRTFGEIIGLIGIGVAALFTSTVLLMSVDDRSREIALLRAVGYPRGSIGRLIVEEGMLLSLFGLSIGLPMAFLGTYGLNEFLIRTVQGLPTGFSFVSFDLSLFLTGLGLVLALGLVASIVPAARAMQLPVAEELRAP